MPRKGADDRDHRSNKWLKAQATNQYPPPAVYPLSLCGTTHSPTLTTPLCICRVARRNHLQVLGGYLASRYGGDLVLAVSYALWTPLSALTSILSSSSDSYIFSMLVCRLAIGMAQGMIAPSSDLVLGCWVPSSQRGRYFSFAGSGRYFGSAVAMATVPIIGKGDLGARHVQREG